MTWEDLLEPEGCSRCHQVVYPPSRVAVWMFGPKRMIRCAKCEAAAAMVSERDAMVRAERLSVRNDVPSDATPEEAAMIRKAKFGGVI